METVVIVTLLLVSMSFIIKLSFQSRAGLIIIPVAAAIFIAGACDLATSQSRTQIADWLSQPDLMLDTAVLLTIDVAMQLAFCILSAAAREGKLTRTERILHILLKWIPGILIFPALFVLLVALIFALPGSGFTTVAWVTAVATAVVAVIGAIGIRWLLPDYETRLELIFLLNSLIAVLGVIATVNGRTAVAGVSEVDWRALGGVCAILIAGLIAGLCYHHRKIIKNNTIK